MKKVICLIIAIAFLLLPLSALCAGEPIEEFGDFRYRKTETDVVIWYYGNDENVVIPEEINGYPVTIIGINAFTHSEGITAVTIPEGVTKISLNAFNGCTLLTSITLPESLVEIGDGAFEDCWALTSITIPQNVTSIGENAFSYCTSLTEATINGGVINWFAFSNCQNLSTLNLGENVTHIGMNAFFNCYSLSTVTIPENVESIDYGAFSSCTTLTNVILLNPDTVFKEDREESAPMFPKNASFNRSYLSSMYAFRNTRAQSYALEKDISFIPIANVVLNGEKLKFDVPAIIENDRVLVPMRGIFEALGAEVGWEGETSTVTAQTSDTFLSLQIGNTQMQLGNETVTLDVPAQIVLDRTVVPVRAVSEGLNATVDWNEETQTVVINTR